MIEKNKLSERVKELISDVTIDVDVKLYILLGEINSGQLDTKETFVRLENRGYVQHEIDELNF